MRSIDSFFLVFSLVFGIGGGVVLLAQFLSLRVRNTSLPPDERDPHVGRKFALSVFLHLAVLLLLAGLTVFAVDIFEELINGGNNSWGTPATMRAGPWTSVPPPGPVAKPFPNAQQRVAFGLILSGVIHGVLFAMLLFFATNARKFPAISRAFVLNRLLVAGVILMLVTTQFCLLLFSEGDSGESPFGRMLGIAVVWGPAAIGHLLWLLFGLNKEKAKATRMAEVGRPPQPAEEGDRPRRRSEEGEYRPRSRRRDDD